MPEQNTSPGQSPAPDFSEHLKQAQQTGDFDFVLDTAKKSHRMLTDFSEAIKRANYQGRDAAVIATGLAFLDNMIANSAGQLAGLKQAEKQTREAIKAATKNQSVAVGIVEPDGNNEPKPADPCDPLAGPEAPHA